MKKKAVLFDLGNTLVSYFSKNEFPKILEKAINEVQQFLLSEHLISEKFNVSWHEVQKENYESPDHRVRPLENRLCRIFKLDASSMDAHAMLAACNAFMKPIFARARLHDDVVPTLNELKRRKHKLAIVSNTPWGSPAPIWREHLETLGLTPYFDEITFCRDVGWRKPAAKIFEHALHEMGVSVKQSVFVGDDFRWDVQGSRAIGMETVLIVRNEERATIPSGVQAINSLEELLEML